MLVLLAVELVVVIVLVFVFAVPFKDVLSHGGLAILVTMALLSPTFHELGRRKPKLSIVADPDRGDGVIDAPTARPWPVDVGRVVAHELTAARETLSSQAPLVDIMQSLSALSNRPSEADHARARETFEEELAGFETSLRDWLDEYSAAARERSQTFDLTLRLNSAARGAYAEGVKVELDLGATVTVAQDRRTVSLPPERPCYQPPRPRLLEEHLALGMRADFIKERLTQAFPLAKPRPSVHRSAWEITDDGRRLETRIDEVHTGQTIEIGRQLLLHADGAGHHEITWTVYTKSARARGTITLVVPPDPDRPAFGRLHGVTSYPDVPIVDDDGEVVHHVRTGDPPPPPPVEGDTDTLRDRLRQGHADLEWRALGLDP